MHPKKDSHSASLIDNQSTEPYNINNRKRLGRGFQGLIGDVPQMHVGVLNRMSGRALEWQLNEFKRSTYSAGSHRVLQLLQPNLNPSNLRGLS